MAKLKAGRLAREVPDACLQYWGGMGYTWDNPVVARLPRRAPGLDRRRRRRGDARHHLQVHGHSAEKGIAYGYLWRSRFCHSEAEGRGICFLFEAKADSSLRSE